MNFYKLYVNAGRSFLGEAFLFIGVLVYLDKNNADSVWGAVLLVIAGVALISYKIRIYLNGKNIIEKGIRTQGKIVAISNTLFENNERTVYKYTLEFKVNDKTYVVSKNSAYLRDLMVSQELTVFYLRENPAKCIVPAFYEMKINTTYKT